MARGKGVSRRGNVCWLRYADSTGRIRRESSGSTSFRVPEAMLTDKRKAVDSANDPPQVKRVANVALAEFALNTWHGRNVRRRFAASGGR